MEQHNYTVKRISLEKVSSFLVYRTKEAILVDSGNSGSEEKILDALGRAGLEPRMLKLLILTHAHFDHAGSASKLKELTGCKIMVHHSETERLKAGFTTIPSGTRWKAKLLVGLGRTFARHIGKYPGAEPDLLVKDSLDLEEFGFAGRVIHTPGHTHGSMVVLMEGGELFAGDTLFGVEGKQHFPPFAEDLPALLCSWKLIRTLPFKTIYPAHGMYFSKESFLNEYDQALKKYSK
ncbi:MAG: MBL fold metallo-hydrolase [Bacteroidales bacterium]|nr:MBL fold metallo-hydrolase [Bacteroidales bacterium]